MKHLTTALQKVETIRNYQLSIYDVIDEPYIWFNQDELAAILRYTLIGRSLGGLPLRTRSKEIKKWICSELGYPIPRIFKRTQPRFIGQNFDVYVQKSNNLQIWNEELDPQRRYILIKLNQDDIITKVKVVSGIELAKLDTTGTLTQKYQARLPRNFSIYGSELISLDTDSIKHFLSKDVNLSQVNPMSPPRKYELLPIEVCFDKLQNIVGTSFIDSGAVQERLRGNKLHQLVCQELGYNFYHDDGQYPDLKHQLLEVKLQTSPTIDLGIAYPNSCSILDIEQICNYQIRHYDVRYAIFYGIINEGVVHITGLYMTSGKNFFDAFEQFGGNVVNRKIQIPLPQNFFS